MFRKLIVILRDKAFGLVQFKNTTAEVLALHGYLFATLKSVGFSIV